MYAYRPLEALPQVSCPVTVLVAQAATADDEDERERRLALEDAQQARRRAGRSAMRIRRLDGAGHALMRHRPDAVIAELLLLASA
jgi:pimeloyl-ACP methyl ester carboxylesterase